MHIKQMTVPIRAIMLHIPMVKFQPRFSVSTAMPYVEIALPIYVHELITPEAVETLPYFAKNGGSIDTSILFMPCIQPVSTAERMTENAATS